MLLFVCVLKPRYLDTNRDLGGGTLFLVFLRKLGIAVRDMITRPDPYLKLWALQITLKLRGSPVTP